MRISLNWVIDPSQAGVTFPGTGLRWILMASESKEEPRAHHDIRHDIRRIIGEAMLGVVALTPFASLATTSRPRYQLPLE